MKILSKQKLHVSDAHTCGWTAIKRNGQVTAYVRERSFNKINPPSNIRSLILHEKGAQATIVLPYHVDAVKYLESHIVEIPVGQEAKAETQIIGCKCILTEVDLFNKSLSEDNKEMLLVFKDGKKSYEVVLEQTGGFLLKEF